MTGISAIVRGDALNLPITDDSVDLVVTSPPYFALRSYTDGGEHYEGQIGDEPTPQEFVANLLSMTRECMRVLKPGGSLWVNLGDKYAGSGMGGQGALCNGTDYAKGRDAQYLHNRNRKVSGDIRPKSLLGVPWRYALGCIDELGLILRAEVIWSKPNGLPESVNDRVRRSHEQWFHFTLEPRYYSAVDEVRDEYVSADRAGSRSSYAAGQTSGNTLNGHATKSDAGLPLNPLGKLPGSVWTVPTEPLVVPDELGIGHFAAFPTEWPRRIINGWSPAGVCLECGQGRRPVRDHAPWWKAYKAEHGIGDFNAGNYSGGGVYDPEKGRGTGGKAVIPEGPKTVIIGYACACDEPAAPTRPGVVLDPFSGTGTTTMVARALGRIGIGVDLSADYCRLGRWRSNDLAQLAKARGEAFRKPEPQTVGQEALWS